MRTSRQTLMRLSGSVLLGLLAVAEPATTVRGGNPTEVVSSEFVEKAANTAGTASASFSKPITAALAVLCVARRVAKRSYCSNCVQSDSAEANEDEDSEDGVTPCETTGNAQETSGWERIRTSGTGTRTAVFKTAALDHSATHPSCYMANT